LGWRSDLDRWAIPALNRALEDTSVGVRIQAAQTLWRKTREPSAISVLARELERADAPARALAAETLDGIGNGAAADAGPGRGEDAVTRTLRDALPVLSGAVADRDGRVRVGAARCLLQTGQREPATGAILDALTDTSVAARRAAVHAIDQGWLSHARGAAERALLEAAGDFDDQVRMMAISSLGRFDASSDQVVATVSAALDDTAALVVRSAAQALGSLQGPERTVALLAPRLRAENGRTRANAISALIGLVSWGPEARNAVRTLLPGLLTALEDRDAPVRAAAARCLASLGEGERAVPTLIALLDQANSAAMIEAINVLGMIGPEKIRPKVREATDALVRALSDPYWRTRSNAATALGNMGPAAREAVPALTRALQDTANVQWSAAKALGAIGPAAREAVPTLVNVLGSGDWHFRSQVISALGQIGEPDLAVAPLIAALRDPEPPVRRGAAEALGKLGSAAREALPALGTAAKGDDRAVRRAAEAARVQIGSPRVEGADLLAGLRSRDAAQRLEAMEALGAAGPEAAYAVPELVRIVQDREARELRIVAAVTALRNDHESRDAQTAIAELVTDHREVPQLRVRMALAIAPFGVSLPGAIGRLNRQLEQPSAEVRATAAMLLGTVGPIEPSSVEALIVALRDPDAEVRRGAALALGNFGTAARKAAPRLKEALEDPDANVREAAAAALKGLSRN